MREVIINLTYLVASVMFIVGLKGLTHPRKAVRGNRMGALAMFLAVVATLFDRQIITFEMIIAGVVVGALIGAILAIKIQMTAMPQLVALFNGFGGGASVLVAGAALIESQLVSTTAPMIRAHRRHGLLGAATAKGRRRERPPRRTASPYWAR